MQTNKIIVIYGGSFNPILYSHLSLAQQVINEYPEVESVIFAPVNSNYDKTGLESNKHRYQMVRLAIKGNPKFLVTDIEIKKEEPVYTYQVLEEMQKKYPDYQIWFLLGSDNLKLLNTWKKAETLVKQYHFFILERNQDQLEEILEQNPFLKENKQAFKKVENRIPNAMSATIVRKMINQGKDIRYLTREEVCKYIQKNKLYQERGMENDKKLRRRNRKNNKMDCYIYKTVQSRRGSHR